MNNSYLSLHSPDSSMGRTVPDTAVDRDQGNYFVEIFAEQLKCGLKVSGPRGKQFQLFTPRPIGPICVT